MPAPELSPAVCTTCGEPLAGAPLAGGHCARCLFAATFRAAVPPTADVDAGRAPADTPWTQLGGCELYEEIGRGGMGVVYRARQIALDRVVVVKVLRHAPFAGEEERARFRREAQAAARLSHPGIVRVFDVGESEGVPWFSMEHVPGRNLEQLVRERPLAARPAARCVHEVAEAIAHAHAHGVLHRDLKPSNILLDEHDRPRVSDFGIARIAADLADRNATRAAPAELTQPGRVLGSPGYAAPEQALRGVADPRTDVYGLGALLFHLLTGRPPFTGPTLDAILVQLRDHEPIAPRRLVPGVPRDLETICLRCLHRAPEARYATAAAVAEDLARFLAGKPVHARPPSAAGRAWRWARRHPAAATLGAVVLGLAFVLAGGAVEFSRRQARAEHRASLLAEARNLRQSRLAGAQDAALAQLREAWTIEPSKELRDEATACLAEREIGFPLRGESAALETPPPLPPTFPGVAAGSLVRLDDRGERVAVVAPGSGRLQIRAVRDDRVLFTCEHPEPVTSLDWSGGLIATGCANRFIYIWDDAGRLRHRFSGHQAVPVRVSFRPRSQELVSTARDPYVRLWHAARGEEIVRREVEHAPHTALWWSADGRRMHAALEGGGFETYPFDGYSCFDLLAPAQEEPHSENLGSADFSADGELAVVIDEAGARLWDFRTGRLAHELPKPPGQWLSARFSPDGRTLWSCGWAHELAAQTLARDATGSLAVGPAKTLLALHGALLRGVSDDGRRLVLSHNGAGEFLVVPTHGGSPVRVAHPGTLATALAPDGTWLLTTSYATPGARVWSLPGGTLQRTLCENDTVMQAVVVPGGRLIVHTSGANRVFRTHDWSEERTLPPELRLASLAASPDGRRLATLGEHDVRLLDTTDFTEVLRLTLPPQAGWLGESHLVFDGDGSHLLVHTALGAVARWNLAALERELAARGFTP